jgi:hypothetical protein
VRSGQKSPKSESVNEGAAAGPGARGSATATAPVRSGCTVGSSVIEGS